jgi:hypothetical protein
MAAKHPKRPRDLNQLVKLIVSVLGVIVAHLSERVTHESTSTPGSR